MDMNIDHEMSLSKSKWWYSNNCLHFLKHAVPLKIVKFGILTSVYMHAVPLIKSTV